MTAVDDYHFLANILKVSNLIMTSTKKCLVYMARKYDVILNAHVKEETKSLIYSEILQTFMNFKVMCRNFAAWNYELQCVYSINTKKQT